jgi:hypothetical protein
VTVDATGFDTERASSYYRFRRGEAKRRGHRRRAWPKLTALLETASHLVLGVVARLGPTNEATDFAPVLRQATALLALDTVLADRAYDGEGAHRLCRETLGLRQCVIPINRRNRGRRWPMTPYRRALFRHFPHALYHQRWHAESGFSRHKRRLGAVLVTRSAAAQLRELVLRVLCHNLMVLRPDAEEFNRATRH